MVQSTQLRAVYQRSMALQERTNALPDSQQAILSNALEELQAVLEELQTSEEELLAQNEALVSTRQAAEAERKRYQELFEFAPDGYLVTDAKGRIQEANRAIATMLKVSQHMLVGKPLYIFIDRPYHSIFHLQLDRLQRLEELKDWEIHLCSQQCSPFDAAITVSTVHNALGQIVSLRWLLRDITKLKEVERLLEDLNAELEHQVKERTAELQQALDFEAGLKRITDKVRDSLDEAQILQTAVRELVLVLNLICCSTALYDIALATSTIRYEFISEGAASPSLLGQTISMTTLPETYPQLLQGDYFQFCEIEVGSGSHHTILVCPILISGDKGVLGDLWLFKQSQEVFSELEIRLVQQVTNQCSIAIRQARLYQASKVQIQEMKKLDLLKDCFLSTTSHELRSPLATIRMATRMLQIAITQERTAPEVTKTEKAGTVDLYLQILDTECSREINLINDLLDFQRFETGENSLVMEPISLQDWLPHVIAPFYARAQDRQQTLRLESPENLPVLVSNRATVERILTELLTNACKYTPSGGQITVQVQASSSLMQVEVSNPSMEISSNELTHVFDKFYRIPNSDPWNQGGTGLGLALVQKQIEQLGGSVTVEHTLGQIHFRIELPLAEQIPEL